MAQEIHETQRTVHTNRDTATEEKEHGMTVAARVITLIGGLVMGVLALRFVLMLFGADRGNVFADFIYSVSYPLAAPFFGLFGYQEQFGQSRFEVETLVAIVVYALIMWALLRIVTLTSRRDEV